jgi:hypothetical protein
MLACVMGNGSPWSPRTHFHQPTTLVATKKAWSATSAYSRFCANRMPNENVDVRIGDFDKMVEPDRAVGIGRNQPIHIRCAGNIRPDEPDRRAGQSFRFEFGIDVLFSCRAFRPQCRLELFVLIGRHCREEGLRFSLRNRAGRGGHVILHILQHGLHGSELRSGGFELGPDFY